MATLIRCGTCGGTGRRNYGQPSARAAGPCPRCGGAGEVPVTIGAARSSADLDPHYAALLYAEEVCDA